MRTYAAQHASYVVYCHGLVPVVSNLLPGPLCTVGLSMALVWLAHFLISHITPTSDTRTQISVFGLLRLHGPWELVVCMPTWFRHGLAETYVPKVEVDSP